MKQKINEGVEAIKSLNLENTAIEIGKKESAGILRKRIYEIAGVQDGSKEHKEIKELIKGCADIESKHYLNQIEAEKAINLPLRRNNEKLKSLVKTLANENATLREKLGIKPRIIDQV